MARLIWLAMSLAIATSTWGEEITPVFNEHWVQLKPVGDAPSPPVITTIAVDPRGELLAVAGDDHVIRILRADSLSLVRALDMHHDWVRGLDFSPDGSLLASAGNDGCVMFWERDREWTCVEGVSEGPALRDIRFSPNGKVVAAVGFTQDLTLISVDSDARPKLQCGCRDMRAVSFRADGLLLAAAGRSGDLQVFDAVTGSTIADVPLHKRRITGMAFIAATSRLITVSEDGHAIVYDIESRQVIHDLVVERSKLMTVRMIDDQHAAVAGSDNIIRIYNVDSGQLLHELRGHTGSVATLAVGNGALFSGGFDTTVRRWRLDRIGKVDRVARQPNADPTATSSSQSSAN